jgi:hypothetical protein
MRTHQPRLRTELAVGSRSRSRRQERRDTEVQRREGLSFRSVCRRAPNAMHFSCRGVRRRRATQQVRYPARLRRADAPVSYKCGLGGGLEHLSTAGEPPKHKAGAWACAHASARLRRPGGDPAARPVHRPGRPLREPRGAGPREPRGLGRRAAGCLLGWGGGSAERWPEAERGAPQGTHQLMCVGEPVVNGWRAQPPNALRLSCGALLRPPPT